MFWKLHPQLGDRYRRQKEDTLSASKHAFSVAALTIWNQLILVVAPLSLTILKDRRYRSFTIIIIILKC